MQCPSCGERYDDRARFCPGCGERITFSRYTGAPAGAGPGVAVLPRDELAAAVAARRELGERMEPDVIGSFLERVEQALDARVDARVNQRLRRGSIAAEAHARNFTGRIAASLGIGIPLTAIAGGIGQVEGMLGVWASIVVLNVFYTWAEMRMKE